MRRLKSLRLGVWHTPTATMVPFATLALAKDGGLMASPADLPGATWSHGPVVAGENPASQPGVHETTHRPKLHYHRSGIVRASLTGMPDLAAESSTFTSLPDRDVNTILGITATMPQAMKPAPSDRRRDIWTAEGVWPTVVGVSFAVIERDDRTRAERDREDEEVAEAVDILEPIELVAETPSQFTIDLSGHGHDLALLGQINVEYDSAAGDDPTITIAAFSEPESVGQLPTAVHALWNTNSFHPMLNYVDDFFWEADRESQAYIAAYVQRFGIKPPWVPD